MNGTTWETQEGPEGTIVRVMRAIAPPANPPSAADVDALRDRQMGGGSTGVSDAILSMLRAFERNIAILNTPDGIAQLERTRRALGLSGYLEGMRIALSMDSRVLITALLAIVGRAGNADVIDDEVAHHALLARVAEFGLDGTEARDYVMYEMIGAASLVGQALSARAVPEMPGVPPYLRQFCRTMTEDVSDEAAALGSWLAQRAVHLGEELHRLNSTFDPRYLAVAYEMARARMVVAALMTRPDAGNWLRLYSRLVVIAVLNSLGLAAADHDFFDDRGAIRLLLAASKYAATQVLYTMTTPEGETPTEVAMPIVRRHEPDAIRP